MPIVMDQEIEQIVTITFPVREGQEESLELTIGPESFVDLLAAVKWAKDHQFWDDRRDRDSIVGLALANYGLMQRVKGWQGVVDREGQPVPCTEDNKLRFFGRYPLALRALSEILLALEEDEAKNSETSRPG